MFGDIQKTLNLADDIKAGAPNFLLTLGLCCYTEYWSKLKCSVAKDKSQLSFEAFLVELEIYTDIRCGLAHAYLIENRSSTIDTLNVGEHGIL
jgi:hypothetical protein